MNKYNGVDAHGNPIYFSEKQLTAGMVIKLRKGVIGLLVQSECSGLVACYFEQLDNGSTGMTDLYLNHPRFSGCDIVEVYAKRSIDNYLSNNLTKDRLIWKSNSVLTKQELYISKLKSAIKGLLNKEENENVSI